MKLILRSSDKIPACNLAMDMFQLKREYPQDRGAVILTDRPIPRRIRRGRNPNPFHLMTALTNDPARCELLNLGWGAGGHGPYLVRQEGYPPGSSSRTERFILQKDGRWLINLAFVMLSEAEQEKQLFRSPAEVIQCFEDLCVKPVQADASVPSGVNADEIMAHFENCANRILRGMRTGSVMPTHALSSKPLN